jgi:hypothetical protein
LMISHFLWFPTTGRPGNFSGSFLVLFELSIMHADRSLAEALAVANLSENLARDPAASMTLTLDNPELPLVKAAEHPR